MNKSHHEIVASEKLKARRAKSREVSSRFLSPSPMKTENVLLDILDVKGHNNKSEQGTLTELDSLQDDKLNTKQNLTPSPLIDDVESVILPGRFSVDECALYRTSPHRNSFSLLYDSYHHESDSELSDVSFASNLSISSSSVRSRKPGIQVPSKYLHDLRSKPRKCSNYTNNQAPADDSQKVNSFRGIKNMIKKTNSLARYGSSTSQWALSPGRSRSPPLSLETKAVAIPCSRLKPHPVASPSRDKGLSKLLNLGFDFFKSKKKSSSFYSTLQLKPRDTEAVHQLKLLHNRLVQWRFVNAKACAASNNIDDRRKKQILCASGTVTELERSVLQERIGMQKRKLENKLGHVLLSQTKHLEAWQDVERQHLSALLATKQCLHSVVSRLPLTECAKVDVELALRTLQKGETLTDSITSTLTSFGSSMEGLVPLVSELAEVVAQEKLMLEECHHLLRMVSELEMRERSLRCCYMVHLKQTSRHNKLFESCTSLPCYLQPLKH